MTPRRALVSGRSRRSSWLTFAATLALVVVFLWIAREAGGDGGGFSWDERVTELLVGARTGAGNRVFWGATILGNTGAMVAFSSLMVLLLAVWGKRALALFAAAVMLLAQGFSFLAKELLQRNRPPQAIALIEQPGSHSLPSGHAFLTLTLLSLLVFLLLRATGGGSHGQQGTRLLRSAAVVVAAAIVALVGVSRVYLGVHWASDVIAGWCLGGAWVLVALLGFSIWERSRWGVRDSGRWLGATSRALLVVLLAVITLVVVFVTAWMDPLLT